VTQLQHGSGDHYHYRNAVQVAQVEIVYAFSLGPQFDDFGGLTENVQRGGAYLLGHEEGLQSDDELLQANH